MACITHQEQRLLALVNQHRAANGLLALRVSALLMTSAQQWAEFIAAFDYWPADPHTGPDGSTHTSRAHRIGYDRNAWVGGCLLYGQMDADRAFATWKSSPPHNANMLSSSYREIGVALAVEPDWNHQGDVFLAASMELGTGQSAIAHLCGAEPKPPVEQPTPPPMPRPGPKPRPVPKEPRVPIVEPPPRNERRRRERLIRRLLRRLRRR